MNSGQLKKGQKAKIFSIGKDGFFQRKMFEMGILPGAEIELIASHPFRGPLVFRIGQSQIALGRNVAAAVKIEIMDAQE